MFQCFFKGSVTNGFKGSLRKLAPYPCKRTKYESHILAHRKSNKLPNLVPC